MREMHEGFGPGILKEKDCLADLGVDGRIMDVERHWVKVVGWIYLAQNKDEWLALVHKAVYLQFR